MIGAAIEPVCARFVRVSGVLTLLMLGVFTCVGVVGVLLSTGAGGSVEDSLGVGAGVVTLGSGDCVTTLGVGVVFGLGFLGALGS